MNEINNIITEEELLYNQNFEFNDNSCPINEIAQKTLQELLELNKKINELNKDIKNINLSEIDPILAGKIQSLANANTIAASQFGRHCEISANGGLSHLEMDPLNRIKQLNSEEERIEVLGKILSKTTKHIKDQSLLKELNTQILPAYGEIQTSQGKFTILAKLFENKNLGKNRIEILKMFISALPDNLRGDLKGKIWEANGENDEGRGLGFGDYMLKEGIHTEEKLQIIYRAILNLC